MIWLTSRDFTDRFGTREIRYQLAEHGERRKRRGLRIRHGVTTRWNLCARGHIIIMRGSVGVLDTEGGVEAKEYCIDTAVQRTGNVLTAIVPAGARSNQP